MSLWILIPLISIGGALIGAGIVYVLLGLMVGNTFRKMF